MQDDQLGKGISVQVPTKVHAALTAKANAKGVKLAPFVREILTKAALKK